MTTLREQSVALADATAQAVEPLADPAEVAAVVAGASALAWTMADVWLAARLAVAVTGLAPPDAFARLMVASTTILALPEPAERLARFARAEPLSATQAGLIAAMEEQPGVAGWTRRLGSAEACPLCRKLADGTVLPNGHPMAHHPGCTCWPEPVTS